MCSPRSHFVYETIAYFVFLLLFSYYLICIEWHSGYSNELNRNISNEKNQTIQTNQTKEDFNKRIIEKPIWIDYLLSIWVFSFFSQEISQVCFKKID